MKKYNLINNVCGWLSFVVAAIVYLLTIEPTASFWDCGEFITSSYKLEVGHPPGAPFFMLTAKFFTLFASDPTKVAMMVNAMSAIMSALTILFLFWTITHLAKKLIYTDSSKEMTMGQTIAIMGSGLVGALVYTFSDTFWFSAVEAEVYAYSSMFTALVFWLILKWENRANTPSADKWLIIIAYAMGLSIGVHLLNLLCIPAIVLVYYFKKNEKATVPGILLALVTSFLLILVLMYGVIPGFSKVGGWFELLFVNSMGLSYNTGALTYLVLLAGSIIWCLYETIFSKGSLNRAKASFVIAMSLSGVVFIGSSILLWIVLLAALIGFVVGMKSISFRFLNTSMLCLLVILVGYSSFALIPIRSIANTPMDQNSPEHVFTLASYLNREQYGDRPLVYGKTYASSEARDDRGRLLPPSGEKINYDKVVKMKDSESDKYVVSSTIPTYSYDNSMLFPRMHSKETRHTHGYQMWGGVQDLDVAPTMMENIRFFFSYQLDYMYFRYFMWNFSGRQNDIQGDGSIGKGNWITGIGFVDEFLGRGPQDNLPPDIADNKGHNKYFALPFILGILGIIFQLSQRKRGEEQFLVTFMLFFMTGIAIILYLNQQPFEPRERDYAYAGSFYAYSIWIGLGVAFLWNLAKKVLPEAPAAILVSALAILVPIQMGAENWDDHDRSGRFTMRDFAKNYLDSCEPNAILFTMGDNDTFPLWYMQEVEGFRTDVRVCNLSYLQTDWYVDQMRRQAYDSEALPIKWSADRYTGSRGQGAHVLSKSDLDRILKRELSESKDMQGWVNHISFDKYYDTKVFRDEMPLEEALSIVRDNDKYIPRNPLVDAKTKAVIVPASRFSMKVDTTKIDWKALGSKPREDFVIDLGEGKGAIYRQEMMIMEMLNNISKEDWKRPIYHAVTIGGAPLELENQSILTGINYRIVPGKVDETGVDVDVMYDNMVNKYQWGGIDNPKVYLDENNLRMCRTFRYMFAQLVSALTIKGDTTRALSALDKCIEVIPGNTVPREQESMIFADTYLELGEKEKGEAVLSEIIDRADRTLAWYAQFEGREMLYATPEIRKNMELKLQMLDIYQRHDTTKFETILPQVLEETKGFLEGGVAFSERNHPLDVLMQMLHRQYVLEEGVEEDSWIAVEMENVVKLMQVYKPELIRKYFGNKLK